MPTIQGNQGQTGKQVGNNVTIGFGEFSDQLASELQPRYYENTYRGQKFSAINSAAVTVGVLTTSNVSFALYNPPNSGKNLAIVTAGFGATSTTFATGTIVLAYNPQTVTPSNTTALTIKSNLLTGNPAPSVAQAYSTATLSSTPIAIMPLLSVAVNTTAPPLVPNQDLGGQIILAPGGVISIQGTVASSAVGLGFLAWDEIPV